MNIKECVEQVENSIKAYLTKDQYGNYIIPIDKQRPLFLVGAPGIGKTAIIYQIADSLDIGCVCYSLNHHTRQSLTGLPMIKHKKFDDIEFDISSYTMSEIISAIYERIELTGKKEGILFIDEINCISETLMPILFQFLQYKTFGKHKIPEGWVIVTAGNPPEYNNSVKEFDVATLDRLKKIDIEPDYKVWKEYAYKSNVHQSIISYLDLKKENFYKIESTVDGKRFVTARGWEDLSAMIKLYEDNKLAVDEKLISQYIQNDKICKDYGVYYALFKKYESSYAIDSIINGTAKQETVEKLANAKFDERLSFIGLILKNLTNKTKQVYIDESIIRNLFDILQKVIKEIKEGENPSKCFKKHIAMIRNGIKKEKQNNIAISLEKLQKEMKVVTILEDMLKRLVISEDLKDALKAINEEYTDYKNKTLKNIDETDKAITNILKFCDKAFNGEQEMLLLITEMTVSYYISSFISTYSCEEYFKYNKELLFYDRQQSIKDEIEKLDI